MAHQCNMNRSNVCHKILPHKLSSAPSVCLAAKETPPWGCESLLLKMGESPLAPNTYMEEAALASSVQLHELEMEFYCVGVIKHLRDYLLQSWYTRCCKVVFSMCIAFSSIYCALSPPFLWVLCPQIQPGLESSQLGIVWTHKCGPCRCEAQLRGLSITDMLSLGDSGTISQGLRHDCKLLEKKESVSSIFYIPMGSHMQPGPAHVISKRCRSEKLISTFYWQGELKHE